MIGQFKGPYTYNKEVVENWNSTVIGVYYIGVKTTSNNLTVYYIGKATGEGGIRRRLLEHLTENKWGDITHFGYQVCDTKEEANDFELEEIKKYTPKYNELT